MNFAKTKIREKLLLKEVLKYEKIYVMRGIFSGNLRWNGIFYGI